MFLALIVSGNANNSSNARPFYSNTNNSSTNTSTNIGAHLMLNIDRNVNPATWQKIIRMNDVLVAEKRKLKNASQEI